MTAISGQRTLHRLIYTSRQAIPSADLDYEVGLIIQASIRNNRAASVTGLLLIHDGWFVQALEGPAEAVMTTYGRIVRDPRHAEAKTIVVGPAAKREFGDWNMCARGMNATDGAIIDTLSRRGGFAPDRFSGDAALKVLKAVRGIQARNEPRAVVAAGAGLGKNQNVG